MLVLIGIAIIIAGFLLRFNPLLVIMASALATGLAAGLDVTAIIAAFGKAFNDTRYVSIVWIVLPVIGLLEAYGLQQHARSLIGRIKGATLARLLASYLLLRQAMSAVGLTSVAGHPQTVRPLVAPMAEAAAEAQGVALSDAQRDEIRAYAAATDNVGLFFGEDIFLAIGSILLMKGLLEGYGYVIEPLHFSVWAIPTAIAAFLIHGFRLRLLEKRMLRAPGQGIGA
ncbi:MAG: DUF969 domain-containing protein [Sphingopyxis terrae]|uniref:DUF969 domain-containing protein n=1 Tax=Sphingopyxis terrae subsp. terrae NBRC 15098 TaxID=1219058 RepID=A0A142VWC9_9SPHN|nr:MULTISPECIES: DUF969 domain-containing protein [Sphingopyxis]AMU94120.1 hypothetical protein AOA14_05820 [Sphingopyxis terrae subsp. terrae NBRC 15098]MBU7590843.1 DUF969 domain-containing protein [Sphingopyxis terrae]QXF11024.1 DUF969 domain-containing protein [Sphingopyxis terrae subsp. terrae]